MSRPLRIVMLSTFHEGCGIATYTEALGESLTKAGAKLVVLAPFLQPSGQAVGEQPPRLWARNRASVGQALATFRAVRAERPHVVHAQVNLGLFSIRFLAALCRLCRLSGIPFVATLHGRSGGRLDRRLGIAAMSRALAGATVVVHNEEHRRELSARRVVIIPHGIGSVAERPLADAKAELGLGRNRPVIAHFGFIHPDKGIEAVLRAVAELRSGAFPELSYRVVGGTFPTEQSRGHLQHLRGLAHALGLDDAVHLGGEFASDARVLAELAAADWVVLNYNTGQNQGTSGAARHAMRGGRPVAVSAAPVFDDLRHAAYTVTPPLAQDLTRMLTDTALSQETERRCREYCEENSWERVAARHLELYEKQVD